MRGEGGCDGVGGRVSGEMKEEEGLNREEREEDQ